MISVIIPTFNEETVVEKCLNSLLKQSFDNFEIIVVDDGSTDNTRKVVLQIAASTRYPSKIILLDQDHGGAGAARNMGAEKAKGDILVFVDADMTFEEKFLSNLVGPIQKGKTKGTFSKDEYVSNWDNVWSRCWNYNQNWQDKKRHAENYPDKQPVFRAILKSEFDKVGGFDPGGYDDDWSLYKKLGYMATVVKGAYFYHKNPDNLKEIFFHAIWSGKRNYKLGFLGVIISILRASIPVSVVLGLFKSLKKKTWQFLIFKIIYDLGLVVGIVLFHISKKGYK